MHRTLAAAVCALGLAWGPAGCGSSEDDRPCGAGLTDRNASVAPEEAGRPGLQTQVSSFPYGACLTRVSDHIAHDDPAAIHVGSRHQAFNADETVILLRSRQVMRLSDSAFVAQLPSAESLWVWAPDHAGLAYAFEGTRLSAYDWTTKTLRVVRDYAGIYARLLPETELGEVSREGDEVALAAELAPESGGGKVLLRVDVRSGRVLSSTPVLLDDVQRFVSPRWLQVLPSGAGFVAGWLRHGAGVRQAGVELYDGEGRFLRQVASRDDGGAIALDGEGAPWYVHVVAGEGATASQTLLKASLAPTEAPAVPLLSLSVSHHAQISCLSWGHDACVVSINRAAAPFTAPPALDGEVVSVSLRSRIAAPLVQRLVQHQSMPRGVYPREEGGCALSPALVLPQPSLDRRARRVLFASNWGAHCFAELYMLRLM